ncbi:alanine racemase [Aeromicrobium piscarium]|uniref:YhfX family PLP-dependent enzyme n=1 Tax=Aeromicrobium piscarium TaxID=2590901 RepID=A0A554RVU9_9ACTN|nr:alanine racemase [Aeromicrobium piscarium]TSD58175.1 YhfX family PLP-dependent enzyme [Aeromicrobium piscarium]
MFLPTTQRRNPELIDAAVALHRDGVIEPDTYVIDRDAVARNAAALATAGREHDVDLWFVAKQYGRNPLVSATIAEHIGSATAIDHREAQTLLDVGVRLANLGHLVQIPVRRLPALLAADPGYVTVTDNENLRAVAAASSALGRTQRVFLKVRGAQNVTFPGQDGGFELDDIEGALALARGIDGAEIAGVTGFPCISFDESAQRPEPTETYPRVVEAARLLSSHGIDPLLSLPSHTSVSTIGQIADLGGHIGEPGHALTGTTPEHAVRDDLVEQPALVYVSEIAQLGSAPSVFGGGFYSRGHARRMVVHTDHGPRAATLHKAPAASIDYYRRFDWDEEGPQARIGDTAVMAFRTQIFVTRSQVAVVSGLGAGAPRLDGVFDPQGRRLR